MDQSLKEQSEKSIVQILNSSAEEMLRSFYGQYNSSVQENNSQEDEGASVLPASHEEPATEGMETTANQDPFQT
ncbi:hypothetical protein [Wolbachia endosymbiont of Ctenocephalides felis wCfeJ]|uniref:hypothetical protein n=1 Tax=Wolbachia endosymbiont of Ctenocephalides felis wCfeJ TaxID=2732594 RepID=UPI001FE27C18|nr:hypothetical protein [Wolbachia endosymbiont of Ctenocephalides felis wCfeJ]WCR57612.1 MAG: hypothetical protein PG980_000084 [Wolbachia endosymbiont of Ctenocephalides felis wCfeJ]